MLSNLLEQTPLYAGGIGRLRHRGNKKLLEWFHTFGWRGLGISLMLCGCVFVLAACNLQPVTQ